MEAEIRGASISAVKRLCSNRPLGNTCHNSTCRSVPAAAHALSQHRVLCYSDLHSMRTVLDSFVFILTSVFILAENIKNTKQYKTDTHRQELYLSFPAHPAKAQRISQLHPPCCPCLCHRGTKRRKVLLTHFSNLWAAPGFVKLSLNLTRCCLTCPSFQGYER